MNLNCTKADHRALVSMLKAFILRLQLDREVGGLYSVLIPYLLEYSNLLLYAKLSLQLRSTLHLQVPCYILYGVRVVTTLYPGKRFRPALILCGVPSFCKYGTYL